ncbi:MAG: thiamine pyrophosphate-binding protein [Candidatus Tectomicrobia bacterium]
MAQVVAARLIGQALKQHGVETIFYLMGAPNFDLINGCQDVGIRTIDVRHEQAAAMAAHGYARVSGTVGVCVGASGPGTLNLLTGVYNAQVDLAPLIVLGGASAVGEFHRDAFQEVDQVATFTPVSKWAFRVYDPQRLPEYIHSAYRVATQGRPGAVYVDLPGDVLEAEVEEDEAVGRHGRQVTEARPAGEAVAIEAAIDLLTQAERPVLVAGSGVFWSQAWGELRTFVETANVPFYTTPMARGLIPEDHRLAFIGARSKAFREADLVLVIGTRLNWVLGFGARYAAEAKIIHVDIAATEIGHNHPVDVGIVGDAKLVLQQLITLAQERLADQKPTAWIHALQEDDERYWEDLDGMLKSPSTPIHPLRLCEEIRAFVARDAIIAIDGNEIMDFGRHSLPCYHPGHRLNSGATGCLGVGLPFGLGAAAAKPDTQVLVLHDGGSMGMHVMEIDTAVRHNLRVVTVVSNNGGWTAPQPNVRQPGRELGFTAFDHIAQALGAHAERVEHAADIRPALERAFASGTAAVINVITDPLAKGVSGCQAASRLA